MVCKVSVHTIVFIPPRLVYNQINKIEITTVNQNGTPKASKTIYCMANATKNSRKEAPVTRDNKKKKAPVL